jgi:trehalose-phosphatase
MRELKENLDLDKFFRKVSSSEQRALFLDYDGTLAPFKIKRDEALPYPGIREALGEIPDNHRSRLVLISGRAIDDLVPLLNLERLPEIWGSHGLEHLSTDGTLETAPLEKRTLQALESVRAGLETEGLIKITEEKPGCVAIHWRGLENSDIEELRNRFTEEWSRFARNYELFFLEFDGGLELRARGRNKAFAIHAVLDEMSDDTIAAFLGDDTTDEEAFRELGGENLGVLVRSEFRPTAADLWLKPPDEVLDFLKRWKEACI